MVILILAWGNAIACGTTPALAALSQHTWLFLVLSGLATRAPQPHYFWALRLGPVSKVAPFCKPGVASLLAVAVLGEAIWVRGVLVLVWGWRFPLIFTKKA